MTGQLLVSRLSVPFGKSLELRKILGPACDPGQADLLIEETARLHLRHFFGVCAQLIRSNPGRAEGMETLLAVAQTLSWERLLDLGRRPEFTSWVWKAREALAGKDPSRIEFLTAGLGNLVLPLVLAEGKARCSFPLLVSGGRWVYLNGAGIRLGADEILPEFVTVTVEEGSAVLPLGKSVLTLSGPDLAIVPSSESTLLPRRGRVTCPLGDRWYDECFPRDSASRAAELAAPSKEEMSYFVECLDAGEGLIGEHWPEMRSEIDKFISVLLPISKRGDYLPLNLSVHAFRGVIALAPRPGHFSAQTLVHETTHNKFSSVLDLFQLFTNGAEETFYSPFVKAERPMANLFHGAASFLMDASISVRMAGKVPDVGGTSIARYVADLRAKLKETLATIEGRARLTPEGNDIVQCFHDVFKDIEG